MRQITATVQAYISQYNSVKSLMNTSQENAISQVMLTERTLDGWVLIGSATVTLNVADDDTINGRLVETLREVQTSIKADAQKRVTEIEQQIQSLLAIESK